MAKNKEVSLQEAFLQFKRKKQGELNYGKRATQRSTLRHKFVEQCRSYTGVPYKRRYHVTGSAAYNSPLFLDCCGLIRRVLRDLRADFGFNIGPWNQGYMFDTLPLVVEDVAGMKAGDLVFVIGRYFKQGVKRPAHDVVHVEVWAGDCYKTIAARWNNGFVQVFDDYRFKSRSYGDMTYQFRSIDTWLEGVCKSFCPEHPWHRKEQKLSTKSIFYCDVIDDDVATSHHYDVIAKDLADRALCCALAELRLELYV
ncbi:uncharacterized protein LOC100179539 [Ciona intestinalis]